MDMHNDTCDLRQALDRYYAYLKVEHKDVTRALYATILEQLAEVLGPAADVRAITPHDLYLAVGALLRPDLADATKIKYKRAIRTFFYWLVSCGILPASPVRFKVETVRINPLDTHKAISDDDIDRMLAACLNARDRALVLFFKCTAIRLGGAWNLRTDGIDPDGKTITTREIKNDQLRTVSMPDVLYEALRSWLQQRARLVQQLPEDHGYVFTRLKDGGRLTYFALFSVMRRLGERAGVKLYSAHKYRHAWGVWAAKNGVPVPETQAQLGHSSPATTWNFYYKSTPESLRITVERRANGTEHKAGDGADQESAA